VSRKLAAVALLLWIGSLCFTGLATYDEQHSLSGAEILAMGWLGPLALNFAWYANVFFLLALAFLLLGTGTVTLLPVLAAFVSLDTFRFDSLPLNEAGASTPIYGIGVGALLWFLAILATLFASAYRASEVGGSTNGVAVRAKRQPTFIAASIALAVLLGGSSFLAVLDRIRANELEAQRLQHVVFKRGSICAVAEPVAAYVLAPQLELQLPDHGNYSPYPFSGPLQLLEWGVPVVRMDSVDYSVARTRTGLQLVATQAREPLPSRLIVARESSGYAERIRLLLASTDGKQVAFDQRWTTDQDRFYCPDYHSFPEPSQQPRKALMQSLGLSTVAPFENIVGIRFPTDVRHTHGVVASIARNATAMSCPEGTGFPAAEDGASPERRRYYVGVRTPFLIGDKAYFPGMDSMRQAACAGGFVYLYGGSESDGRYVLHLEKHSLDDFSRLWTMTVAFPRGANVIRPESTRISRLDEQHEVMEVDLVQGTSGPALTVRARLPDKP